MSEIEDRAALLRVKEYATRLYLGGGLLSDMGRDLIEILIDAEDNNRLLDAVGAAIEECGKEGLDPNDPVAAINTLYHENSAARRMAYIYGLDSSNLAGVIEFLAMGCGIKKVKR